MTEKQFDPLAYLYRQFGAIESKVNLCATAADLTALEMRLTEARRAEALKDIEIMKQAIDEAFRHALPGTDARVDAKIKSALRDERAAQAEQAEQDREALNHKLTRRNLKLDEYGQVVPRVNPVRYWFANNWMTALGFGAVMVVARPDWFLGLARAAFQLAI